MAFYMRFGKYKGTSLEEIALGKQPPMGGGKSEGYYYFNQLATGDPQYFSMFQDNPSAMRRWHEIHKKLNRFKPVSPCSKCKAKTATVISVAYGYAISMDSYHIACDSNECRDRLTRDCNGATLYPIGFDLILGFGWSGGGDKGYEKMMAKIMKDLAGWTGKRLAPETATDFIDGLILR